MGTAINSSMTAVSVLFTIFMNFLELLIAYIQAYVFTLYRLFSSAKHGYTPREKKLTRCQQPPKKL